MKRASKSMTSKVRIERDSSTKPTSSHQLVNQVLLMENAGQFRSIANYTTNKKQTGSRWWSQSLKVLC